MDDPMYGLVYEEKMKAKIPELIVSILRATNTITEWVLGSAKGQMSMMTTLVRKPETKREENAMMYACLKQFGAGFREKVKDTATEAVVGDMICIRKTDRGDTRVEEFLANLYAPLVELLFEIHNDHSAKRPLSYFNQPIKQKKYTFEDEYDLLYT
jgi:hypothetical protein